MRNLILCLLISINASAQFGRGAEWHEHHMTEKAKTQYSRAWKIVGLTMIGTGLYLARTQQNPQRLDVPLIGIGNNHVADLVMSKAAWDDLQKGAKVNIETTEDFKKKYIYKK